MHPKSRFVLCSLVLCLLCGAAFLAAQERGSVRGVVKDAAGQALEGAKVSITGSLIPLGREFVTGRDGAFLFQAVPPGTYTVLVTHPRMMDYAAEVLVNVDRQTTVNVTLSEVGRVSEEVTVQAVSPVVDLRSTEVSASWQKELVEKLPMGRSYSSLFQLAPGVADNRDFAPNAGGNKQDNVYLYDGSNITNPLFGYLGANFSEMDIQEVNIKRGGISAEFGRAAGMVTNAITKSGGNNFTGSLRFVFEPSGFTGASKDPTLVTKYNQSAPSFGLGGPLIKDRVFFYVSANLPYSKTTGRINNLGDVPDAKTTSREFFGKITANPFKAHLLSVSLRNNDYTQNNSGIGVNDAPSVAIDGEGSDWIIYGSWVWTISQSTLLEARYDHVKENYSSVPITDLGYQPAFDIADLPAMGYFRTTSAYIFPPATLSGQYVGAASEFNIQNFFRDEAKLVLSQYLDLPGHSHVIKAGVSYDDGGEHLERIGNGWGSITTYTGSLSGGLPAFRGRMYTQQDPQNSRGRTYSIFVQDNITIADRLTLTLGVLLNRDEFSAKTAGEKNTFLKFGFGDEIQPRLGFTYTLFPKAGDKIYANWGRYNNMDNRSLARAAAPIRIFRTDFYFSQADGTLLNTVIQAGETGKVILPNASVTPEGSNYLKPTYTDEYVVGYSRPFAGHWSVELWGQYRTVKHVIEDFPTANRETSPGTYVYGNLDGQTMSYGGSAAFTVGKAKRVYKAANIEIKKQYSDNWSLSLMYTWSKLYGNWDLDYAAGTSLFYSSSYIEDAPGLYIGDPGDAANLREGIMTGSREHVVKVFGTWQFYKNATLGWFGRLQSGRPWEARLTDYYGNYYRYAEKAGSRTLDTWINLDLQLSYLIPIGRRFTGTLEARLMNIFDTQTVLNCDVRQDQPTFMDATSYAPPRKFALSFYLTF
ncbi:MAG TPA: TonB-dependent receptor [Candidatus Aminicenantes bacterium]|nr:TonB-dependent receptor [Candidatus Aminicenantes bacterium]HRY65659.1 TonB-dependent receptor [Candidatus Aminicenantes bacterium]HRZ72453.1 TonB-dependent receptor [Candidatus Aminicenantes bacterium]